ncbi:ADP-ribosylation/Crystallin J1 [Enterobacter cloacae]|uniref:ADP-ribosylation/Crystallin J1 n=1 Tax=Enterobacter cloacae TaxID=550 RepID=A0A377LZD4_ENTCL|nr:ADP-ribosylation/Crystallin J1 [Enterobacter cloacae]
MKQERILGALYGQALGDAMGMPSELWPRKRVKAHFGWIDRFLPGPAENNAACYFKRAEFTDDTSMALCLADAIIECDGEIDADVIGKHILNWALDFDAFNKNVLGPTSKIALNAIRDGKPVSELDNNGVTNGAAMRASRWAACYRRRGWNILSGRSRWPPARRINRTSPSPGPW